ncbi:Nif11-like leader peptide family natural product precursor [Sunxiuqinia sp. A32]|uniref:Nif11-like leader peptide family natural product precursor n=1 Tax=Sunxiuqinia sp. A32 TaxID=3461496 RepID=UPI0040463382
MAINDAMKFIKNSQEDKELRQTINQLSVEGIFEILPHFGYEFTMDEFEESVNMMHVKCQFEEEANRLMQTAMWFRMAVS